MSIQSGCVGILQGQPYRKPDRYCRSADGTRRAATLRLRGRSDPGGISEFLELENRLVEGVF